MSNSPHSTDDEPIIGFTPAPDSHQPRRAVIGQFDDEPAEEVYEPDFEDYGEPATYYVEDELEPYYADYVTESPTRNPWFYAFLVAAALIGAAVVFGIVRSIDSNDNDDDPTAVPAQILQVGLVSPRDGDRLMAGEEVTFAANVASSQDVTRVELLIDDRVYAQGNATPKETVGSPTPAAQARLYEAVVKTRFPNRGEFKAVIRVTAGSETRDTSAIRVLVNEAPSDPRVEARVIATTLVRTGPGDDFPEVDRLQPGANVLIAARTGNSEWLLLDDDAAGERWVRRNAVQEASPLASIPVRDVTATPQPSPTPTPDSEETPTPGDGVPDFAPSDARFVFGTSGRPAIRISIVNSGADFTGPVVVEAGMSSGSLVSSQLVFDLSLRSGRVATVDFELAGAVPDRTDISVSIDPGNAVRESNEDNNSVTFNSVAAPLDPPELLIDGVSVSGTTVNVTVINIGGALPESQVSVRVSVGGGQATQSATASLETNGTLNFTVEAPGTGTGTVQVLIDGATAASRSIEVGTAEPTVTETATTTTTATAEVTPSPTTVA